MGGPGPVNIVDAQGNVVAMQPAQAAQALQADPTLRLESAPESTARAVDESMAAPYQGVGGKVVAAGTSALSGATLGGSDALLGAIGAGRAVAGARAANPDLSTGANIVGAVLPTLLSGGATAGESAAELGTLGLEGGVAAASAARDADAGASLARSAASVAPSNLAARAGTAVKESLGGGIVGRLAGGATEGGIFGAGNAVSQLALSDDPLTAEHVASTLGSNVLLGAGIGAGAAGLTSLAEKALLRAGDKLAEASAAKAAIQGIPDDLAGLDDAGLKAARATAVTEHAADIDAEKASLEQLRVEQRAELANQVRDLHTDLATERPIYSALTEGKHLTLDLDGIGGVADARVQLAKSYSALRSGLDSEISAARDPRSLIRPLEMRQAALEKLQAKAPEIQAAMAGDARAATFAHVNDALEQTKGQISAINELSPKVPVASGRLAMLEAGPSAKMATIDAAREALKNAPEMGLLARGATTAAFAGGTALAHMIPGVGIAAPFVGKAASEAVGRLFGHLSTGVESATAKSAAAARAFLAIGDKLAPLVPATATKVLSAMKFAPGPEPKSGELADVYTARSQELRSQTMYAPDGSVQMRPEARMAMAKRLDPIRTVSPGLADKVETAAAARIAFESSKLPRRPDVGGIQIGPDKWQPSDMAMRSFARTVRACEDPHGVEQRLALGNLTPEDAEAYRACYPERFQALQQAIFTAAPKLAKTLSMQKHVVLSTFVGFPTTPALQPNVLAVLQGNFAAEPGSAGGTQAPKPMPSFGALGSAKSLDKPTPAQAREGA